jgi:hypothetical protein
MDHEIRRLYFFLFWCESRFTSESKAAVVDEYRYWCFGSFVEPTTCFFKKTPILVAHRSASSKNQKKTPKATRQSNKSGWNYDQNVRSSDPV